MEVSTNCSNPHTIVATAQVDHPHGLSNTAAAAAAAAVLIAARGRVLWRLVTSLATTCERHVKPESELDIIRAQRASPRPVAATEGQRARGTLHENDFVRLSSQPQPVLETPTRTTTTRIATLVYGVRLDRLGPAGLAARGSVTRLQPPQ